MAYDVTFKGRVDLSGAVKVGEPIKKSGLRWSVPYHVKDAAGNAATVWRDIVVEEVALGDVETKIRDEILQHQKAKIQIAVDRALEEDRRTRKEVNSVSIQEKRPISPSECPKCDCSGQFEESLCHATCEARIEECAIDDQSYVIKLLLFLERTLPPSAVPFVLSFAVLIVSVLSLRWTMTLIFNPQAFRRGYYDDLERERALRNAVAYHVDPVAPPPRTPFSSGETNGFFSPQNNNARFGASPGSAGRTASNNIGGVTVQSPAGDNFTDIYQSPSFANSVNTPNKQGDGVQRRSPFSHGRSSL